MSKEWPTLSESTGIKNTSASSSMSISFFERPFPQAPPGIRAPDQIPMKPMLYRGEPPEVRVYKKTHQPVYEELDLGLRREASMTYQHLFERDFTPVKGVEDKKRYGQWKYNFDGKLMCAKVNDRFQLQVLKSVSLTKEGHFIGWSDHDLSIYEKQEIVELWQQDNIGILGLLEEKFFDGVVHFVPKWESDENLDNALKNAPGLNKYYVAGSAKKMTKKNLSKEERDSKKHKSVRVLFKSKGKGLALRKPFVLFQSYYRIYPMKETSLLRAEDSKDFKGNVICTPHESYPAREGKMIKLS